METTAIFKIIIHNLNFNKLYKIIENTIVANKKKSILYLNAYNSILALKNAKLFNSFNNADIVHIDGVGLWLALRFVNKVNVKRFNWTDHCLQFLGICEKKGWSIFFLGSTDETLMKAKEYLSVSFPKLKVVGTINGYINLENESVVSIINKSKAQILWIGLSSPKQEIWIDQNKNNIHCHVIQSVGDVFNFLAQTKLRGPIFIQLLGFEWFFRLIQNPKIYWRRYLIGIPKFIFLIIRERIKNN